MLTVSSLKAVLSWDFLATMTLAATAVVAITNTLSRIWHTNSSWTAFIAAEILTFYALLARPSTTVPESGSRRWWTYLEAFFLGFILFCYAFAENQTVVGIALGSIPRRDWTGGWWTSWF
jgi:hypothetical protein